MVTKKVTKKKSAKKKVVKKVTKKKVVKKATKRKITTKRKRNPTNEIYEAGKEAAEYDIEEEEYPHHDIVQAYYASLAYIMKNNNGEYRPEYNNYNSFIDGYLSPGYIDTSDFEREEKGQWSDLTPLEYLVFRAFEHVRVRSNQTFKLLDRELNQFPENTSLALMVLNNMGYISIKRKDGKYTYSSGVFTSFRSPEEVIRAIKRELRSNIKIRKFD